LTTEWRRDRCADERPSRLKGGTGIEILGWPSIEGENRHGSHIARRCS
jgi:hypothetical protein